MGSIVATELVVATVATVVGGVASYYIIKYLGRDKSSTVIKFGDVIRLIHNSSGQALHSHNILVCHPGSSGQQQVTCFIGVDSNDYWMVKPGHNHDEAARKGTPVLSGEVIRLEHRNTRKNLHSHSGVLSPLTGQQEITAFGVDGLGDTNDNWRLDNQDGAKWRPEVPILLLHVNTGVALHSHAGHSHPSFTSGQQEVTGFFDRDENDLWFATLAPKRTG